MRVLLGALILSAIAACCGGGSGRHAERAPDYRAVLARVDAELERFRASLPQDGVARVPWRADQALLAPSGEALKVWLIDPRDPHGSSDVVLRRRGNAFVGELVAALTVESRRDDQALVAPRWPLVLPHELIGDGGSQR